MSNYITSIFTDPPFSALLFYLLLILGGGFLLYGAFCAFHDFLVFHIGRG